MTRSSYTGTQRGLTLALDLGSSYSGISYAVMDPGEVPNIKGVTRFPAQESLGGASKVPSIIFYDLQGQPRAIGAECLLPETIEKAEDEYWVKVEWWKLHLAPLVLRKDLPHGWPAPLPLGKSVCDVFADFLAYLFKCTKIYIEESHAGGKLLWNSVQSNITLILTHPNGWEGSQQSLMRQAAVQGGLIEDSSEGRSKITFVTEGEASFNFCVQNGLSSEVIKTGNQILVIDAGGGTIDLSAYVVDKVIPTLSVKEIFAPECRMHGSAIVTQRAAEYIRGKLRSSQFDSPEEISYIVQCFDSTTKKMFRSVNEPMYIKFGSPKDKDPARGIRNGALKLAGEEVARFFEPCLVGIMEMINLHLPELDVSKTSVLLVGGFSESPWLFHQLKEQLGGLGLSLSRPDGQKNKAVADGAISYFLDHYVSGRIARFTYGSSCHVLYDPNDPEHKARRHTMYVASSGRQTITGAYKPLLYKGAHVAATQEFRRNFTKESAKEKNLNQLSAEITAYKGSNPDPKWTVTEPESFTRLCTIEANTSKVLKKRVQNPKGGFFFRQEYEVILLFGLTEMKAYISWMENGVEKRSPANVMYAIV